MLVHKGSLGVLEYAPWDGTYAKGRFGARLPVLRRATLRELDLDPAQWWEVSGALAIQVKRAYPWFDPVVGENGELLGIEAWPKWRIYGEKPPAPAAARPSGRRHSRSFVERKRKQMKNQKIPTGGGGLVFNDRPPPANG